MSQGCPSCGAISSYGPSEPDSYEVVCQSCGGPHFCPLCDQPIVGDALQGWDGWECMVCGRVYHPQCLPVDHSGDNIVCQQCREHNDD